MLVLTIAGPLDKLFYFSKTQFLHLVCRDSEYLLHRVVVKIKQYNSGKAIAECLTHSRPCSVNGGPDNLSWRL